MKLKFLIGFLIMLCGLGVVNAQNPTLDDVPRGTLKIASRLGVNTNGATPGMVLTFTNGLVAFKAATGGGGGGTGTLTNIVGIAPIVITGQGGPQLTNSFDGTVNYNNSGATNLNATELRSGTVADARIPSQFLTNLTSATPANLTWTGQGTRVMTPVFSYMGSGGFVTNNSSPTFTTFSGLVAANIITNIASSADAVISWAGQGSHTMTPSLNYSIIVTNQAPTVSFGTVTATTSSFLTGVSNTIGNVNLTSSNYFYGPFFLNTNQNPGYAFAMLRGIGPVKNYLAIDTSSTTNTSGIIVGNLAGTDSILMDSDGSGNVRIKGGGAPILFQGSNGSISIQPAIGTTMLQSTTTGNTIGNASGSTLTLNGNSATIPNGLNIGAGQLNIPSSGVISNNSGFFSLKNVTASNLVALTTDGVSYVNSGTNTIMRIIVNSSAGILQSEALFTSRTNTLSANLPVINTIYTNNAIRLYANIAIVLPSAVGGGSCAALWTVSGSSTNYQGMSSSEGGLSSSITNYVVGFVDPSALYMVTNISTVGGTPSLIPGLWNEKRF